MTSTVTRVEIADHIEGAFDQPPTSKSELLATAAATRARIEVLDTLGRLPDRDFRSIRDLWPLLPGVPVDQ